MQRFNVFKWLASSGISAVVVFLGLAGLCLLAVPFVMAFRVAGGKGILIIVGIVGVVAAANFIRWKYTGKYFTDMDD